MADETTVASENDQTTTTQETKPDTGAAESESKDWAAEAEKWKALARKHEQAAKSNSTAAAELEKLRTASLSEQEKAVAEAESRGRQAAVAEVAEKLAAAEIRAALTGVVPDPAAIVEDLNLGRYVQDGEVNTEAVEALKAKFAALAPAPTQPNADLKQGVRGNGRNGPAQLTRADLAAMTPDQIVKAKAEGRLNDLLGVK